MSEAIAIETNFTYFHAHVHACSHLSPLNEVHTVHNKWVKSSQRNQQQLIYYVLLFFILFQSFMHDVRVMELTMLKLKINKLYKANKLRSHIQF